METPSGTEQAITSLAIDLEKLSPGKVEPDDKYTYKGVYSNDLHVAEVIPALKRNVSSIPAKISGVRVGLVIASGGILSLGKELPEIDLWIVLDKSPGLIKAMKEYYALVSRATGTDQVLAFNDDYKKDSPERESYGSYHYLESQKSLEETQRFLRDKKIVFMNADLLDRGFMTKMGETLKSHNSEVVFANLTNVMEWIPGYNDGSSKDRFRSSLDSIPFNPNSAFLFSISEGGFGLRGKVGRSPLIARTTVGFENYLNITNSPAKK